MSNVWVCRKGNPNCVSYLENRVQMDFELFLYAALLELKRWMPANPTTYPQYQNTEYFDELYEKTLGESINRFFEEIMNNDDKKLMFFIGKRGLGKTTFINYFINKKTRQMNEEGKTWIRIDVSKMYDKVDKRFYVENFERVFYAQLLYVYLRYGYHNQNHNFTPFIQCQNEAEINLLENFIYDTVLGQYNIEEIINNLTPEYLIKNKTTQEQLLLDLQEAIEFVYSKENFHDSFDDKPVDYWKLGKVLFDHMNQNELILFIDGIDNINYNAPIRKEIYNHLASNIIADKHNSDVKFFMDNMLNNRFKIVIFAREEFVNEFVTNKLFNGYKDGIRNFVKFFYFIHPKNENFQKEDKKNDSKDEIDEEKAKKYFVEHILNEVFDVDNIMILINYFEIEKYWEYIFDYIRRNKEENFDLDEFEIIVLERYRRYLENKKEELKLNFENVEKIDFDINEKDIFSFEGKKRRQFKNELIKFLRAVYLKLTNENKKVELFKKIIEEDFISYKENIFNKKDEHTKKMDEYQSINYNKVVKEYDPDFEIIATFDVRKTDFNEFKYKKIINKIKEKINQRIKEELENKFDESFFEEQNILKTKKIINDIEKKIQLLMQIDLNDSDERKKIMINFSLFLDIEFVKFLQSEFKRIYCDPFALEKRISCYINKIKKETKQELMKNFLNNYKKNMNNYKNILEDKINEVYNPKNEKERINFYELFYFDIREMLVVMLKSFAYYLYAYYYKHIEEHKINEFNSNVILHSFMKNANMYCPCKDEIYFLPPYRNIPIINIFKLNDYKSKIDYPPILYWLLLKNIEDESILIKIEKENVLKDELQDIIKTFIEFGYVKIRDDRYKLTKKGRFFAKALFRSIFVLVPNIYNAYVNEEYAKYFKKYKRDFSDFLSVSLMNVLLFLADLYVNQIIKLPEFLRVNFDFEEEVIKNIKNDLKKYLERLGYDSFNKLFESINNKEIYEDLLEIEKLLNDIELEGIFFKVFFDSENFDIGDIIAIFSQYKKYDRSAFNNEIVKMISEIPNIVSYKKFQELLNIIKDEEEFENAKKRFTNEKLINGDLNERLKKFLENYNNLNN